MVSAKTLIFYGALLLLMPEKFHCKFEKIEEFLKKFEVSKSTELPRKFKIKFQTFENAEKSIEIVGFGKRFILDLSIYFHNEDANIEYISKESNSTGKYQDLKAILYQGHVRNAHGSFALGFFTQNNLFRGYFMTDEVYCVEPHGNKESVIVYKLSDVIFPGCSKMAEGDGLDCSKTKYFEPWKPSKPRSKLKFDYRVLYDEYLQRLSPGYKKDKTHMKKDNDSKSINHDSDNAKDNQNSTVNTNEHDIKDKNHHNDTKRGDSNKNNSPHNHKENKLKKNNNKMQSTSDTKNSDENFSEKYRQNRDELERWLSESNGNYSDKNKTDYTHKNNNEDGVNKTHSDVDKDRDHDDKDDDKNDDDDKIHLSNYVTYPFHKNSSVSKQDLINTSHSTETYKISQTESPSTVSKAHQIKSQKDGYNDRKREIYDFNFVDSVQFSENRNSKVPIENFPKESSKDVTSAGLNSILFNTENLENNMDDFVNNVNSLKMEEKEKKYASFSPEKKSVQKRQIFDDLNIPYASIEGFDIKPVEMECSLEILISPEFRKKFNNHDADAIKDIFIQITLVNKIFQKVVLKRKSMPFHANFRIGELIVFKDDTFSPFQMKGELEDVVRYFYLQKRSCLSVGLINRILKSPSQFVDGYLPRNDDGGACARYGNFFVVSHGNEEVPAPMGLYFAALMRGFTRGFGATDENEKCKMGALPNPMQVLRDNLLAKQITLKKKPSIFNDCNLQDIEKALKNRKCLVELKDHSCGNAIIDVGEECDCGPGYICERLDPCCKPHLSADEKVQAWLVNGSVPESCKLHSDAQCGMSQPCCDNCLIKPGERQKICYYGTGSCDLAYCNGKNASCPTSATASDGLVCDEFNSTRLEPVLCKKKQCEFGLCSGSGLTPCTCANDTGKECLTCCLKDGKCKAAVSELRLVGGEDFPLLNGANCTGGICFRGKCVLEAGIQAANASVNNPASMIRNNKILTSLYSVFATVIALSVLLIL